MKRILSINRHVAQRMGFTAITLMAIATVLPIVAVVIYILIQGLPAISLEFLTGFPHDGMRAGGILPKGRQSARARVALRQSDRAVRSGE